MGTTRGHYTHHTTRGDWGSFDHRMILSAFSQCRHTHARYCDILSNRKFYITFYIT